MSSVPATTGSITRRRPFLTTQCVLGVLLVSHILIQRVSGLKYNGFTPFTKPETLQWPSLAAISFKYSGDESFMYETLGVLVSPRHVLTSGYTFNNNWYAEWQAATPPVLRQVFDSREYADVKLGYSSNLSHWIISYHVPYANVIYHPTYSTADIDAGVNLALLLIPASALIPGTRIVVAPLAKPSRNPNLVGMSVILPWMRRAQSESTYRLVMTTVPIISQSEAEAMGLQPNSAREELIYTKNSGLPHECIFHSEWIQKSSNESFKLTGPVFRINADGDQVLSGIYFSRPRDYIGCDLHTFTRVDSYAGWIAKHRGAH